MTDMHRSAETDESPYEWGVQWDDGVIAYSSYEIAAHEQQFPTRMDHVNPVLVYREVGPWEQIFPPASTSDGGRP